MFTAKGKASWIDIENPRPEDLKWLRETYRFHPLIIDELKGPSARARIESHKAYLYFIYYFPVYDQSEKVSRRSEIDFLITKRR